MRNLFRWRQSLGVLLTLMLFSGCTEFFETPPEPEPSSVAVDNTLQLAENSIVVDENSPARLESASDDGSLIVFAQNDRPIRGLMADDVLIIAPQEEAPYGLLRKVVSVERQGEQVQVRTVQATLPEAFEAGELSLAGSLDAEMIEAVWLADGVSQTDPTERSSNINLLSLHYENAPGELGGLDLTADLSLEANFDIDLELGWLSVERFGFSSRLTETTEVDYRAFTQWEMEAYDKELAKFRFKPIRAGYFWIYPEIEVELRLEGQAEAGITGNFYKQSWLEAGAVYQADRWSPLEDHGISQDVQAPTPYANGRLRVSLVPELEFKLYNVVGPQIDPAFYVEAVANTEGELGTVDGQPACAALFAGLSVGVAMDGELLGVEWEDYLNLELLDIRPQNPLVALPCPGDPGTFEGAVYDIDDRRPLPGVQVVAQQNGQVVGRTRTLSDGSYRLPVPGDTPTNLTYSLDDYLPHTRVDELVPAGEVKVLPIDLKLPETYGGQGDLAGRVIDATTGDPLAGAAVSIRRHYHNMTGRVEAQTLSDAQGNFSFAGLEAGAYTVEALQSGYVDGYMEVEVRGNRSNYVGDLPLSPQLPAGQVRVVMTWGAQPRDLDAHLTGPATDGGRFHVYWSDMAPYGQGANLDIDDVTSYGPETITITEFRPGVYRYSIHDYTNRDERYSTALARSELRIEVFSGSDMIGSFVPPTNADGTVWTVFEMHNAQVVPINEMGYEVDPGDVNLLPDYLREKNRIR